MTKTDSYIERSYIKGTEPKHNSVRVFVLCLLTGGWSGVLALLVGVTPAFLGSPVITAIVSFVVGAFVGFVCSALVIPLLRRKEFRVARRVVLGIMSPLVCMLAMCTPALSLLIVLSALCFLLTALIAWLLVPKVWEIRGLCRKCGYDLRGSLTVKRCPECGIPFIAGERLLKMESAARVFRRPFLWLPRTGVLAAVLFGAAILVTEYRGTRPSPFNQARWNATPPSERKRMARYLAESGVLIGLTETDVVELLGVPNLRIDCDIYRFVGRAYFAVHFTPDDLVKGARGAILPKDTIHEDFDAALWKTGTDEERLRMARSLSTDHSDFLNGRSRAEVHGTLGTPTERDLMLTYRGNRATATSSRARLANSLLLFDGGYQLRIRFLNAKVEDVRLRPIWD